MEEKTIFEFNPGINSGEVNRFIFGGFLEHMGRAVYGGVYDPENPLSDKEGLREDVKEALNRLNFSIVRYPGGNFVSGYRWTDGIGPRSERPSRLDLAWNSCESNQFGTDEYITLCRKMNWEPMITVNLGTGTPQEAADWVEYCNRASGTKFAEMRRANGHEEPYNVKYWCLGNEMDGPWQVGHLSAEEYAKKAQLTAQMIKIVDPTVKLIACGTSAPDLPTALEWDRIVLEYLWDDVDYISIHRYLANKEDDFQKFLYQPESMDLQIRRWRSLCRFVKAKKECEKEAKVKDVFLSIDEWNVWYKNMVMDGKGEKAPRLLEEEYNYEDALVVAGFLNTFIRHADFVKIANIAQIVNVIAPILTSEKGVLLQTIFPVLEMFFKRRKGISLMPIINGILSERDSYPQGKPSDIDLTAILDEKKLHTFIINRNISREQEVVLTINGAAVTAAESVEILTGTDAKTVNSFENPDSVRGVAFKDFLVGEGRVTLNIPPHSFLAATWKIENKL